MGSLRPYSYPEIEPAYLVLGVEKDFHAGVEKHQGQPDEQLQAECVRQLIQGVQQLHVTDAESQEKFVFPLLVDLVAEDRKPEWDG